MRIGFSSGVTVLPNPELKWMKPERGGKAFNAQPKPYLVYPTGDQFLLVKPEMFVDKSALQNSLFATKAEADSKK